MRPSGKMIASVSPVRIIEVAAHNAGSISMRHQSALFICGFKLGWRLALCVGATTAAVFAPGKAYADMIGIVPARFEVYATSPAYSTSALLTPGEEANGGCNGSGCASDSASLYYSYGDLVEDVSGDASGRSTAYSISYAVYYFEIVPNVPSQDSGTSIPVVLTAESRAAATDYSGAAASASYANGQVQWPGGAFFSCAASGDANCNTEPSSFSISQTTQLFPDLAYDLLVQAYGYSDLAGTYGDMIDPQVEISPSFPDASDYTLVFSPNVAGSIPEPSTWAMLIVGFAGLGFAGWRGRGRCAAAA
jgi:PEP-CTERM motif